MEQLVKYLRESHYFFVYETKEIMGELSTKQKILYPVAYCRFMFYSIKEYYKW